MSATTAAKPRRQAKAKDDTVIFISRRSRQMVVVEPAYEVNGPNGRVLESHPGVFIQFDGGRYATKDPGEIEYLRNHPDYGNPNDGWFVPEPAPPEPTDELIEISQAAGKLDAQRIREILEDERDGYNREMVLTVGQATLEQVEGQIASPPTPKPEAPAA